MNLPAGWEMVVGLEVHAQLSTRSKLFCSCRAGFGGEPNSRVCPVCLGLPGALPVLNRAAVDAALRLGLALGCRIAPTSRMARKNYFYPDLPKGYQISQYEQPLCEGGGLEIRPDGRARRVGITRVHIEEDAGKSLHREGRSLVDLNRCGTPLVEIVSEPEIGSPGEAYEYLYRLRQLVVWLGICDGNMEEGSLRCDANISMRREGDPELGTRVELKNLNSLRGVEAGIVFEADRQIAILEAGGQVERETRLWDADARETRLLRGKEQTADYRYFPEPDLLPLQLDEARLKAIRDEMPESPIACLERFQADYGLSFYDADILTRDRPLAAYFEALAASSEEPALAARWMLGEVMRHLGEREGGIDALAVGPESLGALLREQAAGRLSGIAAKTVFERMLGEGGEPNDWIETLGLRQISDEGQLGAAVDAVLDAHPRELERYRGGRSKLFGFFVGKVMEATSGRADPKVVGRMLKEKL